MNRIDLSNKTAVNKLLYLSYLNGVLTIYFGINIIICIFSVIGSTSGPISVTTTSVFGKRLVIDTSLLMQIFSLIIGVMAIFAVVGFIKRTNWGKIIGVILLLFSLPSFPIGTLFGVAGLVIIGNSKDLFGRNRLSHLTLKELKKQKNQTRVVDANA